MIDVSDLSKSFNNNIVLKNINFQLLEGESLAIIGASGSGKSVLLKNIIGILQPDKGSIIINDTEMVNLHRNLKEKLLLDLGITFQHGALFELNYIIKDSLRIGAGYNFTQFTDDEFARYDEQYGGPFFRVMAQY